MFYENTIYNIHRFVLQGGGILLGGCLTVKNKWRTMTGDDGVGLVKKYNVRVHRLCVRALRAREAYNQVSV